MPRKALDAIGEFLTFETAAGYALFGAALLAVIADNTLLAPLYDAFLSAPTGLRLGALALEKPLLLWINDGLMAVFFLLVGLEIKREVLDGELSSPTQVALPAIAAVSGMVVPAAIYVAFNAGDATALRGWAIPAATDIAFALGVLALLGDRVPTSLKVFLTAVAILDDIGAIAIIALFYTSDLSILSLVLAFVALVGLSALNFFGVTRIAPYVLVGFVLWVCVLKSGVHATLAGVAVALAIPLRTSKKNEVSPLQHLEHVLHPWVAFGILPLFAFANAGVPVAGLSPERLTASVPLGIAVGLFLGKQFGILAAVFAAVRLGVAKLPDGTNWRMIYGVALLCGIGFTMSLFIGTLAFEVSERATDVRLGVIGGSLLSAAAGYLVLKGARSPTVRR